MTAFRRFASLTAAATLVLVGVGALVRATGSGLGCLDQWPTCRGGWVAPTDLHGLIEYSHRAVAGIVVLLLAVLVVASRRWVLQDRVSFRLAATGLGVVLVQAWLGRAVVTTELHAAVVTGHLVLAMALLALVTTLAARLGVPGRPRAAGEDRRVARMTVGAIAGTAVLLVVGAYVREKGAGLAFSDWPFMGGSLVPDLGRLPDAIHFVHRLLAVLVFGHVVALGFRTRRDARPDVRTLGTLVVVGFGAQIAAGAANVWTRLQPAAVIAHVVLAALVWSTLWILWVRARRAPGPSPESHAVPRSVGVAGRLVAYVRLTKPRIIFLLLVTTVPAMVLAWGGWPSTWLVAATLAGGTLTAGSANAINQYLERDLDEKMRRTSRRPLPSHAMQPWRALVFGVAIGVAGFVWLAVVVNVLSALLAASAIGFYVLVYTVWLKRTTPQNIVVGGAAGAVPVLVGWAAVTGTVGAPAWLLFAIVFLWTPPHFWALAMRYRDDYEAAGVPMLPVVRGPRETTAQIVLYTVALIPVTIALYPVAGMGVIYAAAAGGLGAGFVYQAMRLRREPDATSAMRLFRFSIYYLGLLFAAIAADGLVA